MNIFRKMLGGVALIVVGGVVVVTALGIYRFNVMESDIFLTPTPDHMVGSWLEEKPALEGTALYQGMELRADGKAFSINMATLPYSTWSMDGDHLVLEGRSIGNGVSFDFSMRYRVQSLRADKNAMTLVDDTGRTIPYIREPESQSAGNSRFSAD
ncbi:lipocalin family protein [Sneathiella chinensis]|uniref:Lipocalin-like domain-containing protein n=1 Tax=Sneathiella chinensis TaxID=349750 RepID=A0ABQ5U1R4_9PROT|nr:lipocalin family protein [Sneathiella chinensis]GLQ06122.1 hypothetical protein GCM10007924_13430 [Sneathiella chinensis]